MWNPSASAPFGPNAPSNQLPAPNAVGPANVAPPSTEYSDTSWRRADDDRELARCRPGLHQRRLRERELPSLRIGRGTQVFAPRGHAQYMTGWP